MASLLHRGMIHPVSIVWKMVDELRTGESVIKETPEGYASIVKVKGINAYRPSSPYYTLYEIEFSDGSKIQTGKYSMVRIPPVNPRVVYDD